MKRTATLLGAGLILTAVATVQAGGIPHKDSKPLSEIIKVAEAQNAGVITEAEFEIGMWEVEAHQGTTETTLYIDPDTAAVSRRQSSQDLDESLPPKEAKPLSEIVKALEAEKLGTITEIEFEDGAWEATVFVDGKQVKMVVDPMTGKRQTTPVNAP